MAAIDRNTLWSSGYDESVEVNQRALIDKVLARYSGEFTVFRELLQNSDDAASKAVEIRFESKLYLERVESGSNESTGLPDLKQPVHQWTFRNNGLVFREEDWSRLKKIAEGNPDEEKIGAFGVGFYSLFSVTEEPFVKSGDQWMGFYWKDRKDQLYARRGSLPESNGSDPYRQWTTFEMGLREAAPMPSAFDFVRFLTSSITFMAHLDEVTVWIDGKRLAKLMKEKGLPKELPVPNGFRHTSETGMMTMNNLKTTSLNISAEVLRLVYTGGSERKRQPGLDHRVPKGRPNTSFFSSFFPALSFSTGSNPSTPQSFSPLPLPTPEALDPMVSISSHVVLSVFCGEVKVSLTPKMTTELHRSTKKNPPTKIQLELIYTGRDEYDASKKDEEGLFDTTGSLFQGLRADLDGTGSARIFIGHATGQTTGIGGHVSGRFIPTVERESIDLVDRNVAIWNKELLFIGGLLARCAYELELANIRTLWDGALEVVGGGGTGPDPDLRDWLQSRCLHALRFFACHPSTPSPVVSTLLQAAFFSSSLDGSFPIVSSVGVLDARNVRAFDPAYAGFLKALPVLPAEISTSAVSMTAALRARGMVQEVSFKDVLNELRSRSLSELEMAECLKWRINLNTEGIQAAHLTELRREFIDAAIVTVTHEKRGERMVPLSSIKTVVIPRNVTATIPTDGPLPDHTLPVSLSRRLNSDSLLSLFGWSELTIPVWLENLVSPTVQESSPEFDLTKSAVWAETVLNVLARSWSSLTKDHQTLVVQILKTKTCIPTKFGIKLPEESYFQNANIFPDLPIVTMPKGTVVKGPLEKVLLALGVLQHVNLQVVFHRMVRTGDWGLSDLIRYLVAVENSLTELEIERLRNTVAFNKEEDTQQNGPNETARLPTKWRAMDLYEPSSVLRDLGLPIIAWGTSPKWRSSSDEAKFLFKLGLRRYPPLKDLLSLAAGPSPAIRQGSLKYLIDNMSSKYSEYDPQDFLTLAYVPAQKSDGTSVQGNPLEVFTDREFSIMGYYVVDSSLPADWVTKLKLLRSPSSSTIIHILESIPPKDMDVARTWFELLARYVSDFTQAEVDRLTNIAFIPVVSAASEKQPRLLAPNKCYVGGDSNNAFHSQLFTFVDFGQRANNFLMSCGVRNEPTVDELAQILVADPRNFYERAGGYEKFLDELRNIAVNYYSISYSTRNRMMNTACLVASRRVLRTSTSKRSKKSDDASDEEWGQWERDLLTPSKIAIVDDTTSFMLFDSVFYAPQEDYIERLYSDLGSPRLSTLIREEYRPADAVKDSPLAVETRLLVLERLSLFLDDQTQARAAVNHSWLATFDNFVVTEVGKLTLTRTLQFGQQKMVKTQEASATAERQGKSPVRLWISKNSQLDFFEVSNSLCRVILKKHKANDSLLFMTILSTDLRALRRRGYNVERILRQQKLEREEKAAREQRLISEMKQNLKGPQLRLTGSADPREPRESSENKIGGGLIYNLRQKFRPSSPPPPPSSPPRRLDHPPLSSPPRSVDPPPFPPHKPTISNLSKQTRDTQSYTQGPKWNSDQEVIPHAKIEASVRAAIDGCKAENNPVVRSEAQWNKVKEAMNEGYCDSTGAANLELVGKAGQFKLYASTEGDAAATITTIRPATERFGVSVIRPLIEVYGIPYTSVHIFYDSAGPLIAFNRNGSIFLNARYYIQWHDSNVQQGDFTGAYTSWFFSLAHEIAHNLVHPHNSEHEFLFSSICEKHMLGLAVLLNSVQG